jgi:hypothetical protein
MTKTVTIAAFGALNSESYSVFGAEVRELAGQLGIEADIRRAGPYPNADAKSVPGRPLRADALNDPRLRAQLCVAVASDAKELGDDVDIRCMPCMSMIGFHDGIEQALGKPIVRLGDALVDHYWEIKRVGVIHMRPAAARVADMFGTKAATPDEAQAKKLQVAEEQVKKDENPAAVEAVMKEIAESWRSQGLTHILFARADAPRAHRNLAPGIPGIQIDSYFSILARNIVERIL